mmetsp:Transcript_52491/g.139813  ORF Transcript_52491/g.139813 Transcript_52491/m.139813 type:complete len:445 (-) Transcript_52491:101-1435(-)
MGHEGLCRNRLVSPRLQILVAHVVHPERRLWQRRVRIRHPRRDARGQLAARPPAQARRGGPRGEGPRRARRGALLQARAPPRRGQARLRRRGLPEQRLLLHRDRRQAPGGQPGAGQVHLLCKSLRKQGLFAQVVPVSAILRALPSVPPRHVVADLVRDVLRPRAPAKEPCAGELLGHDPVAHDELLARLQYDLLLRHDGAEDEEEHAVPGHLEMQGHVLIVGNEQHLPHVLLLDTLVEALAHGKDELLHVRVLVGHVVAAARREPLPAFERGRPVEHVPAGGVQHRPVRAHLQRRPLLVRHSARQEVRDPGRLHEGLDDAVVARPEAAEQGAEAPFAQELGGGVVAARLGELGRGRQPHAGHVALRAVAAELLLDGGHGEVLPRLAQQAAVLLANEVPGVRLAVHDHYRVWDRKPEVRQEARGTGAVAPAPQQLVQLHDALAGH